MKSIRFEFAVEVVDNGYILTANRADNYDDYEQVARGIYPTSYTLGQAIDSLLPRPTGAPGAVKVTPLDIISGTIPRTSALDAVLQTSSDGKEE